MNISSMAHTTFKDHERKLFPAIEGVTLESLKSSVQEERRLTLEDIEALKKYL